MKTIIQKPICHINSEELPHMIRVHFLGNDYDEYNEIYVGNTNKINDPIKINDLRDILDQIEEKGANYVSIDFHTDHQELEFDGVHIAIATQEEIDKHNQKDKDFQIEFCKARIEEAQLSLIKFQRKIKELSGD